MEMLAPFLVIGVVALFGILAIFLIRKEKAEKNQKTQIALTLGFTPIEADLRFTDRIRLLYKKKWGKTNFILQNVSLKRIPDGEMYLFDLVNTAGEDENITEDQAIAVLSRYLDLPEFTIFPQVDIEGVGGQFANTLLRWMVSKTGNPIDFSDHPEFQKRYLVSSPDEQGTRRFFDDRKLRMLAQVKLIGIHASGDLFVLSKFNQDNQSNPRDTISERVSQAMDIFQIFTS